MTCKSSRFAVKVSAPNVERGAREGNMAYVINNKGAAVMKQQYYYPMPNMKRRSTNPAVFVPPPEMDHYFKVSMVSDG